MLRLAVLEEGPRIMEMIEAAKVIMNEQGIDQWNEEYPWLEDIEEDINNHIGYVLEKEGHIHGYVCINFNEQEDYNHLVEGSWSESDGKYATIQRMVIDPEQTGKSYGSQMMVGIQDIVLEKGVHEIRLDTLANNGPMCRLIEKNHFEKRGKINSYDILRPVFQKFI